MATSSASISGLSGFDGASLVAQLMQLEAITKNNLTTRVKGEQNVVATLRSLNTALAKLGEQAMALGKAETWNALKATSSSTAVTVTSDATASATQLDFTVVSVAAAHQLGFNDSVSLTDVVTPTSITFAPGDPLSTVPGKTLTTDGTLKGLVDAINADPDLGLRATTVRSGSGYKLLVEATETGATHAFTMVSGVDGSQVLGGSSVRAGSDAVINMGALSVTSATNTFTDLVPGVDVTVGAAAIGDPRSRSRSRRIRRGSTMRSRRWWTPPTRSSPGSRRRRATTPPPARPAHCSATPRCAPCAAPWPTRCTQVTGRP